MKTSEAEKRIKAERQSRMLKVGLMELAKSMLDTERRRIRAERSAGKPQGSGHDPVAAWQAWEIIWPRLEPLVIVLERLRSQIGTNPAGAIGYQGDPDDLVDRGYTERDPGAIVRDSFLWAGFEFRRIVRDSEEGTSCLFERASKPPPTPLAIQIVEEYARRPAGDRLGLFQRLQLFATRTPETPTPGAKEGSKEAPPPDPYLESLVEQGGA